MVCICSCYNYSSSLPVYTTPLFSLISRRKPSDMYFVMSN